MRSCWPLRIDWVPAKAGTQSGLPPSRENRRPQRVFERSVMKDHHPIIPAARNQATASATAAACGRAAYPSARSAFAEE